MQEQPHLTAEQIKLRNATSSKNRKPQQVAQTDPAHLLSQTRTGNDFVIGPVSLKGSVSKGQLLGQGARREKVQATSPYRSGMSMPTAAPAKGKPGGSAVNSYVKGQTYNKKFFKKKLPCAVSHVPVPSQPIVSQNQVTRCSFTGSTQNQSSGTTPLFFQSRGQQLSSPKHQQQSYALPAQLAIHRSGFGQVQVDSKHELPGLADTSVAHLQQVYATGLLMGQPEECASSRMTHRAARNIKNNSEHSEKKAIDGPGRFSAFKSSNQEVQIRASSTDPRRLSSPLGSSRRISKNDEATFNVLAKERLLRQQFKNLGQLVQRHSGQILSNPPMHLQCQDSEAKKLQFTRSQKLRGAVQDARGDVTGAASNAEEVTPKENSGLYQPEDVSPRPSQESLQSLKPDQNGRSPTHHQPQPLQEQLTSLASSRKYKKPLTGTGSATAFVQANSSQEKAAHHQGTSLDLNRAMSKTADLQGKKIELQSKVEMQTISSASKLPSHHLVNSEGFSIGTRKKAQPVPPIVVAESRAASMRKSGSSRRSKRTAKASQRSIENTTARQERPKVVFSAHDSIDNERSSLAATDKLSQERKTVPKKEAASIDDFIKEFHDHQQLSRSSKDSKPAEGRAPAKVSIATRSGRNCDNTKTGKSDRPGRQNQNQLHAPYSQPVVYVPVNGALDKKSQMVFAKASQGAFVPAAASSTATLQNQVYQGKRQQSGVSRGSKPNSQVRHKKTGKHKNYASQVRKSVERKTTHQHSELLTESFSRAKTTYSAMRKDGKRDKKIEQLQSEQEQYMAQLDRINQARPRFSKTAANTTQAGLEKDTSPKKVQSQEGEKGWQLEGENEQREGQLPVTQEHLNLNNVVISNANLQNCNVYINSGPGPSNGRVNDALSNLIYAEDSTLQSYMSPTAGAPSSSYTNSEALNYLKNVPDKRIKKVTSNTQSSGVLIFESSQECSPVKTKARIQTSHPNQRSKLLMQTGQKSSLKMTAAFKRQSDSTAKLFEIQTSGQIQRRQVQRDLVSSSYAPSNQEMSNRVHRAKTASKHSGARNVVPVTSTQGSAYTQVDALYSKAAQFGHYGPSKSKAVTKRNQTKGTMFIIQNNEGQLELNQLSRSDARNASLARVRTNSSASRYYNPSGARQTEGAQPDNKSHLVSSSLARLPTAQISASSCKQSKVSTPNQSAMLEFSQQPHRQPKIHKKVLDQATDGAIPASHPEVYQVGKRQRAPVITFKQAQSQAITPSQIYSCQGSGYHSRGAPTSNNRTHALQGQQTQAPPQTASIQALKPANLGSNVQESRRKTNLNQQQSQNQQPLRQSATTWVQNQTSTQSALMQSATWQASTAVRLSHAVAIIHPKAPTQQSLRLLDFLKREGLGPLGEGHFGKVWLVKHSPLKTPLDYENPQLKIEQQDSNALALTRQDLSSQQSDHAYQADTTVMSPTKLRKLKQQTSSTSLHTVSHKSLPASRDNNIEGQITVRSILPLCAPFSHYALKMVNLQQLTKQKQIEHLLNERDILSLLQENREQDLPAICFPQLYATFKSEGHVNFLMEPIDGISLFDFQREQVYIKMEHVRFFAAKTLVLLEYLHKQRIIFRDLKKENILIEKHSGELKLVDFGFAKDLSRQGKPGNDRTFTKCGTPGYTAPEVLLMEEGSNVFNIRGESRATSPTKQYQSANRTAKLQTASDGQGAGYSYAADVWSWGVFVCELIGGFNPFQGQSVQETFENIKRLNVNWPRNLDSVSSQMLQAIFQRDAALRPTLSNLKKSSFFTGVNWNHLETVFGEAKIETRAIVQSIMMKKKESKSDQVWSRLTEQALDPSSQIASPAKRLLISQKNAGRRSRLTEIQFKAIHDALADF